MTRTATAAAGQKKRKPPTFQHLPLNRAKKLKQSWVEVQKIKSKWKAQKRKEGIVTSRPTQPQAEEGRSEDQDHSEDDISDGPASAQEEEYGSGAGGVEDSGSGNENEESESDENMGIPEAIPSRQQTAIRGERGSRGRRENVRGRTRGGSSRQHARHVQEDETKLSLRELQNQAYSRSSLHNFKSGSHKQHSGGARGFNGRGRRRGGGGHGRGQPDMRLRMNAMLEKIKRDYV
ncbi:hypothetical protein BDY19DRAFT_281000 [Irpex rosettiformis]|uniref:Uncharacterized protein n=1 Tax=Irpex rosettiformis TaxID=378272 RepID=A0ACB8UHV5_9APHY|nr:hypothetical protein BDY19DRAFT_281000 [Irpex rosettiformis]